MPHEPRVDRDYRPIRVFAEYRSDTGVNIARNDVGVIDRNPMTPSPLKFFNPAGKDRAAVLWAEPAQTKPTAAAAPAAFLLRLARGPRMNKLAKGTAFGPYPAAEVPKRLADLANTLRADGFFPSGLHAMLAGLTDVSSAKRGKSALRLGWSGHPEAVNALLAALPPAVDETCAVIDTLGMLGDPKAIPAIRPLAGRKLLSRRRSAVEALRNLQDAEGVAEAQQRALAELPDAVRAAVEAAENALRTNPSVAATPQWVAPILAGVNAADAQRHGLLLDLLYELGTPAAVEASRAILPTLKYDRPFVWRYVKSVLKRSMLRHDHHTFGWIVHEVESRGRLHLGHTAKVKSGYDGVERQTSIFRRETRDYLRRAAWRYLKNLAQHRPARYPYAAAAALIPYDGSDLVQPKRFYGALSGCYLLNRILFGGGSRYQLSGGSMRFRLKKGKSATPPAGAREEAFPHLWDAQPAAYLRLMGAAKLIDVQRFAYDAVLARHLHVLRAVPVGQILLMLDAPFEPTVFLALSELERRFNPTRPDWPLLDRLAADARPKARELGHRFIADTVPLWSIDPDRIAGFLTSPEPTTRALAADLVIGPLRGLPDVRRALAPKLLAVLRAAVSNTAAVSVPQQGTLTAATADAGASPPTDAMDAVARVCREALGDELDPLLTTDDLLALVAGNIPAAQAVAGDLLARRPEAVERLGLPGVVTMAQHPLAAVRSAAASLLRAAAPAWQRDPSVLLALADSDWADTRSAVLDLIDRYVIFDSIQFDGIVGLLDSNRTDVQDRGRRLAVRHIDRLDPVALVQRLAEHPHPNMRLFALSLVTDHLPDGADALSNVEPLCRSALFDVWPQAAAKSVALTLLRDRGLRDADQARVACRVLGSFSRTQSPRDLDRVLETLVRLQLAFPEVEAAVALPSELIATDSAAPNEATAPNEPIAQVRNEATATEPNEPTAPLQNEPTAAAPNEPIAPPGAAGGSGGATPDQNGGTP